MLIYLFQVRLMMLTINKCRVYLVMQQLCYFMFMLFCIVFCQAAFNLFFFCLVIFISFFFFYTSTELFFFDTGFFNPNSFVINLMCNFIRRELDSLIIHANDVLHISYIDLMLKMFEVIICIFFSLQSYSRLY